MIFHFKIIKSTQRGVAGGGGKEKLVVQLPPPNFAFIKIISLN
jgi:hypothetical protein